MAILAREEMLFFFGFFYHRFSFFFFPPFFIALIISLEGPITFSSKLELRQINLSSAVHEPSGLEPTWSLSSSIIIHCGSFPLRKSCLEIATATFQIRVDSSGLERTRAEPSPIAPRLESSGPGCIEPSLFEPAREQR